MQVKLFEDINEFKKKIIKDDPMKTFTETKREINWKPQVKECRECGKDFTANHPVQMFCEDCAQLENKKNKSEAVITRMQKKKPIRSCVDCGNEFILSAPAMKKCEECSPKGGKVIGSTTRY